MSKVSDSQLVSWLLDNAGPVVRYRAAAELTQGTSSVDLGRLQEDLLASALVRKWLGNLKPGHIHNSKDTDFENAMGKLLEFGLKAGMTPFDEKTAAFRQLLSTLLDAPRGMMRLLKAAIVAAGLARAGYGDEEPLRTFLLERLENLHRTTQEAGYDIYIDPNTYGDMPKARRDTNAPLVNPDFSPEGEFRLPYIHDIYALSAFPVDLIDAAVKKKIDAVIRYVLAPEYQALAPGYGLLRAGKRTYYAIGWSVDLPGYRGFEPHVLHAGSLVARIELMAHFPIAREHSWFRNGVEHLESFRTEKGTYLFPRQYLQEAPDRYWVSGAHMGLEEDRRLPRTLEIESTFRMLQINRLAARK